MTITNEDNMEELQIVKKPNYNYSIGCDIALDGEVTFAIGHWEGKLFTFDHLGTFKPKNKPEYSKWVDAMAEYFDCKLFIDKK